MEQDNWKQLLNVTTKISADEAKQEEGGAGPSSASEPVVPPTRDNMEFLHKALSTLSTKQSRNAVLELMAYSSTHVSDMTVPEIASAVELAGRLAEYLELGNFDHHSFGARALYALRKFAIDTKDIDLRLAYLHIIPLLAENRPQFQKKVCQKSLFASLVKGLDSYGTQPPPITSATLAAVSACMGSAPQAVAKMREMGGVQKLCAIITYMKDDLVAAKAARILDTIYITVREGPREINGWPCSHFVIEGVVHEHYDLSGALSQALYDLSVRLRCLRQELQSEEKEVPSTQCYDALFDAYKIIRDRLASIRKGGVSSTGVKILKEFVEEFAEDMENPEIKTIVKNHEVLVNDHTLLGR